MQIKKFLTFLIFCAVSLAASEVLNSEDLEVISSRADHLYLGQDVAVESFGLQIRLGEKDDMIYPNLLWHYRMGCRNFEILHQGLSESQAKKIKMFYDRVIDNCSLNAVTQGEGAELVSTLPSSLKWILQLTDRQILCLHKPLVEILSDRASTLRLPSCTYSGFNPDAPVSFWPQTDERLIYRSNINYGQPVTLLNGASSGDAEISNAAHIATFTTMDEAVPFSGGMVRDQLPFMDVMTSSIRYACHGDREMHGFKDYVQWEQPAILNTQESALDEFIGRYGFNPNIRFSNKVIYVPVEKCGFSTIARALSCYELGRSFPNPGYREFHQTPGAVRERYQNLLDNEFFKITCVRDPFRRAFSMYQDKIHGSQKVYFRKHLGFTINEEISFQDFLEAVKDKNIKDLDSHFRPSWCLTFYPHMHYDLIIKLENFNEEFKQVMSMLGLPGNPNNYKWDEHATKARISEHCTQKCVDLILDVYRDDFDKFGYSKAPNFQLCSTVPVVKLSSNNSTAHITPAIVQQCYQAFLLREPESEAAMNSKLLHVSFETLKQEFLSSPEYQQKVLGGDVLPAEYMQEISLKNLEQFQQPGFMRIVLDNYLLSKLYSGQCRDIGDLGAYGTCGLPRRTALKAQEKIFQNSLAALLGEEIISAISHDHHRMWITPSEAPHECATHIVQKYLNSLSSFDATAVWTHHFWCLDPAMIPNTVAMLESSPIPVQIHSLKDFIASSKSASVFKKLYEGNFYTICKDFISKEIINEHGGVYCDMGFEITRDITPLVDRFNYIFYYHKFDARTPEMMDTGFFAAPKRAKLLNDYFRIVANLPTFSKEVRAKFSGGTNFMHISSRGLLSQMLSSESADNKVLYLNSELYFNLERQNTWAGEGKYGNANLYTNTIEW